MWRSGVYLQLVVWLLLIKAFRGFQQYGLRSRRVVGTGGMAVLRCVSDSPNRGEEEDFLHAPIQAVRKGGRILGSALSANPLSRIIINTYNFWYWLPKRNMPYDMPWQLFKNSTVEWLSWYQFPHNLPPYRYLPVDRDGPFGGYRDDFFCYGLPGNTLPLGNWDPAGFQLASKKVIFKYRESELKHGRLAMLASAGFVVGELYHPLHPEIGGLAITHMAQLSQLDAAKGLFKEIFSALDQLGLDQRALSSISEFPLDYFLIVLFLASFEVLALRRNWTRGAADEYLHQFDHNIGIGNLKEDYETGNYGFDPLRLQPKNPILRRELDELELNHGRLAMVAVIGMIGQEYLTGLPIFTSLQIWFGSLDGADESDDLLLSSITNMAESFGAAAKQTANFILKLREELPQKTDL